MPITQDQIDDFHHFASECLKTARSELSLDDLVIEWNSSRSRNEINEAIREGLADVDAGNTRPADEVTEEMRRKYEIHE